MKRVVIIGAGFGGLNAARALANKPGINVLIVDRENYHLFQPLLYQVAAANIEQEAIAYPLRALTRRWKNVTYRMAEVTGIDLDRREVLTTHASIPYDSLIVAAGAVTNFFGNRAIAQSAYDLKYLEDAVDLRNRILTCFEQAATEADPEKRRALLTFAIVGAGPTGVEYAGSLAELVRQVLVKDYPELRIEEARILLLDALPRVLTAYDEPLQEYAIKRLNRIGVEVMLGKKVIDISDNYICFDDGTEIAAATLVWAAGVKAAPLADTLPVERKQAGRVVVNPDLTLPAYSDVYIVGDMAYLEQDGAPLPMMAPVAMQSGSYAGNAILKGMRGEIPTPFHYVDKGTMAVIGRGTAVARIAGLNFRGLLAWMVWLGLHLYYLIGFKNRLIVMLSWAYDYFTYDRKVRLITRR
jgi:NADH:ubiquinone reductase (H+-translocating)